MQKIIAKTSKLVPGGQALATLDDGKKAFIWGALPNETVEIEITKNKRSYCEAIVTNVITSNPERIAPKDACYLSTSPWQIFNYDFELQQKSLLIQEVFAQHKIQLAAPKISSDGKDFFYRNKMEYSLYWDNTEQKIFPAFHQRGTHRKTPITNSSIERPEIFQKAQEIIDELNSKNAAARDYQSLLIRANQQGTTSAALFENFKPRPQMQTLTDQILGQAYSYSPNGFFQINLPVYEMALQEIAKHIDTHKVLDLYSGVGTIGLSVAKNHDLALVETNASAFSELENNCKSLLDEAQVKTPTTDTKVRPVLAKSEEVLDFIQPDTSVILDPPRAGCDAKLIDRINQTLPPKVIYLSCNPATQARDLAELTNNYQIKHIQAFNFFPRTPHIENLVILQLK